MAASNEMLDAFNEVHGRKKPDDVGMGEWVWGALQGDFNEDRSVGQLGFDMVVSLVPVVDTVCDARDLCANIREYHRDPSNKITLFFIATTVVGFVPEIGTVAKSSLRVVWVYLKPLIKHADDLTKVSKLIDITKRACDAALPKITEYLQHNWVVKWATNGKIPDLYRFIAKCIHEVVEKITPATLGHFLRDKLNDLKLLLQKIRPHVSTIIRERIDEHVKYIDAHTNGMITAIQEFVEPVRTILKVIAKKLDDHAWKVEVYRTNRGWVAPMSESGSAMLINARPPKWVKKLSGPMPYPPFELKGDKLDKLNKAHPDHPPLQGWQAETFSEARSGIRADKIRGPAKLYRVIDPSSEGAGVFWMTEDEFKKLKNRDEWRRKFAVKPEWNQNGWFVEFEIKAGETLPVWRGPAASQELKGTKYCLEGGGEQILFIPSNRDAMITPMPRIDSKTGQQIVNGLGNIDRRVEFTDVTGKTVPTKLRSHITEPNIKGPIETGWGASDYTQQEAQRILLTAPTSP